jgi:fatty-acyl-CoA synthase
VPRRGKRLAPSWQGWLGDEPDTTYDASPVDDVAMIVGTGGTTGVPKGVMPTGHNLETMTALTLMGYPFVGQARHVRSCPAGLTA